MKTILILLISVFVFVSCSSKSGRKVAEPKAKAKIISSGNVIIVQDQDLDNLAVGDTVMLQQNVANLCLSNFAYQRDTVVMIGSGTLAKKVFLWRIVILEKFPVSQPPRNWLLLLLFPA